MQYRVHSALDVVEEKCAPGLKPTQDSRDLYLGLLYSTESHKMYVSPFHPIGFGDNFIIVTDMDTLPIRK